MKIQEYLNALAEKQQELAVYDELISSLHEFLGDDIDGPTHLIGVPDSSVSYVSEEILEKVQNALEEKSAELREAIDKMKEAEVKSND